MTHHSLSALVMLYVIGFMLAGCAISLDQSTVGDYVDDATVTKLLVLVVVKLWVYCPRFGTKDGLPSE